MNNFVILIFALVTVAVANPLLPEIKGYTSRTVFNAGGLQPIEMHTVEYVMPPQAIPANTLDSFNFYPVSPLGGNGAHSRQKRQMGVGMSGAQAQSQAQAMGGGMMGGYPFGMMGMPMMGYPFIG